MTVTVPGSPAASQLRRVELDVSGMSCAACAARVETKLNKVDGVHASVNFATRVATVDAPDDDRRRRSVRGGRAGPAIEAEPRGVVRRSSRRTPTTGTPATCCAGWPVAAVLFVPLADLSVMFAVVPSTRFTGWEWVLTALALRSSPGRRGRSTASRCATPAAAPHPWRR